MLREFRRRKGATGVEYALVLVLIGFTLTAVIAGTGRSIVDVFTGVSNRIDDPTIPGPGGGGSGGGSGGGGGDTAGDPPAEPPEDPPVADGRIYGWTVACTPTSFNTGSLTDPSFTGIRVAALTAPAMSVMDDSVPWQVAEGTSPPSAVWSCMSAERADPGQLSTAGDSDCTGFVPQPGDDARLEQAGLMTQAQRAAYNGTLCTPGVPVETVAFGYDVDCQGRSAQCKSVTHNATGNDTANDTVADSDAGGCQVDQSEDALRLLQRYPTFVAGSDGLTPGSLLDAQCGTQALVELDTDTIDFGTDTACRTVQVTNASSGTVGIALDLAGATPAGTWALCSNGCSSLAAGESCSFAVRPVTSDVGQFDGTLELTGTDAQSNEEQHFVSLSYRKIGTPLLQWQLADGSPIGTPNEYGVETDGAGGSGWVRLQNIGTGTATWTSMYDDTGFFQFWPGENAPAPVENGDEACPELAPGAVCIVNYRFIDDEIPASENTNHGIFLSYDGEEGDRIEGPRLGIFR